MGVRLFVWVYEVQTVEDSDRNKQTDKWAGCPKWRLLGGHLHRGQRHDVTPGWHSVCVRIPFSLAPRKWCSKVKILVNYGENFSFWIYFKDPFEVVDSVFANGRESLVSHWPHWLLHPRLLEYYCIQTSERNKVKSSCPLKKHLQCCFFVLLLLWKWRPYPIKLPPQWNTLMMLTMSFKLSYCCYFPQVWFEL